MRSPRTFFGKIRRGTNMPAGRPRKPTELKVKQGTYRADRDGPLPEDLPHLDGEIATPEFPDPAAKAMWEDHIQPLIGLSVVKPTDVPLAISMCQLWGLYCECYEAARLDPTDQDTRVAVCSYWTKFEQAAARFGMNPSDRSRLRLDKPVQGVRSRRRA